MSLLRTSLRARSALANARRYSTAPESKKSSNLPLYLGAAGVVGLAGYLYLDSVTKEPVKPKKVQEKSPFDPKEFVDFKLKRIEPYNHNTAKYVFEIPNNDASLLPVASCVVVKSAPDAANPSLTDKGKPVIRPYTPISPPDQEGELTFLIKRYEQGKMSQHIHSLKEGEKLSIKGPIMKFEYKTNQFDEVGMIAGGSGITPMYQILTHALSDPTNRTKFTLIFANLTPSDILLRSELDSLKSKHPDTFNVVYTVDDKVKEWDGPTGYVNAELIRKHVAPAGLGEKVKVFICGPPGQVNAIAGKKDGYNQGPIGGILKELGYTEDQVRVSPSPPSPLQRHPPRS
ncbi:ferredoxin reductase-like C-terminal NADP-linked domain-containing protein [Cristinia sonorae]|uniref:NADH-cytochrome b5 reductase n=1 Tax=Cristinia sonorae TaxID=1940300 RepID=A0A8K0XPE5_9AGAR|nr:ferredoxin reductase-like C-terminal NADP-linked domain-containing protein [Cristinia sonorae]